MLCTSGFTDDVTFGRNGPYGDTWKTEPLTYYHYSGVATPGRSLMSMNSLFNLSIFQISRYKVMKHENDSIKYKNLSRRKETA